MPSLIASGAETWSLYVHTCKINANSCVMCHAFALHHVDLPEAHSITLGPKTDETDKTVIISRAGVLMCPHPQERFCCHRSQQGTLDFFPHAAAFAFAVPSYPCSAQWFLVLPFDCPLLVTGTPGVGLS